MNGKQTLRIDKYLWFVRIYKTRSIATDACNKKQVLVNDIAVKPSSTVKPGDKIEIKNPPIIRSFEVKDLLKGRVGAKLVADYLIETTPEEEFDKLRLARETTLIRDKGAGRPTKKDRRDLDKINPYK